MLITHLLSLTLLAASPADSPAEPRPDRTGVEFQTSLSDEAFAGQLAHGRAYQTHLRYRLMYTLSRRRQQRIFGESRMPRPTLRFGVAAGVSATTPSDTSRIDIDRQDRPYTGFAYGGVLVEVSDGARNRLRAELDYAGVGEWSGVDAFHRGWKRAIGAPEPRGWANQTRNELHFHLVADWDRELLRAMPLRGAHLVDVQTHARVELAELAVAGTGGATVRLGLLRRPFLGVPDAAADSHREACGTWKCRSVRSMQFYVYARGEGSAVGRRTTVDGSLFDREDDENRSPHRARSRRLVPRAEIGVVVQPIEQFDVRFALQHTGPEVDTSENRPHTVGRFTLTARF